MTACSSTPNKTFPDITKMVPSKSEEPTIATNVITPEWTTLASGVYREPSGKEVFYGLGTVDKQEMISDKKTLSEDELNKITEFNNQIYNLKLSNNVYLEGYFESEKYFADFKNDILKEFTNFLFI